MPHTHDQFMAEVLQLAAQALAQNEFPIAAIVVLDDQVIARATTSEQREKRFLCHAELNALEIVDRMGLSFQQRRNARLYTNLEPCLMCMGAAMSAFIGGIYYALESPADGAVSLVDSWSRQSEDMPSYQIPKVTGGMMRQNSIDLFKRYVAMHKPGPRRDWAESLTQLH